MVTDNLATEGVTKKGKQAAKAIATCALLLVAGGIAFLIAPIGLIMLCAVLYAWLAWE